MAAEPRLYTLLDLVGRLRLSESTLRNMIRSGRFPKPLYPAERRPRWSEEQLQTYLRALEMGLISPEPRGRKKQRQEKSEPQGPTASRTGPHKEPPAGKA